jgi:hypothetical protein
MKTNPCSLRALRFLRLIGLVAAVPVVSLLRGAEDKVIAAVRAADDARIAATVAANRAGLEAAYSNDLHYVHSSGKIDNKASQIEGILKSPSSYDRFEYKDRTFFPAAPGIVLMRGRVLVHMTNKQTGEKVANDINYLSVWREENGQWRFLSWQAARNLPATPAKK